jgi:Heterokaryon incompatibility protein (HET)
MMTDDVPMFDGDIPEYTCVSYAWGSGRTTNPFTPEQSMSDRTVPALEATIRAVNPAAIWIDAWCVPSLEPARTACLRSMGALYASAAYVVAVLSKGSGALLGEDVRTKGVDEAELFLLENDPWVSRAWTYQEIVNSKKLCFVAEGGSVSLSGMQFLSNIGSAIEKYKKGPGRDSFMLRTQHPRLDNLEDTIADWVMAEYAQRSAYQAMSSMDRRTAERPDDYFNALIGAISTEPLSSRFDTTLHPAEYFMQLCEEKGDFSFIYSSAPRSRALGRSWRPLAGPIPAIQPWHTFGDGQLGDLDPTRLRLHNMCRMTRGTVGPTAAQFIAHWLRNSSGDPTGGDLVVQILTRLRQAGFTGRGDSIELEEGYFFPQSAIRSVDEADVYVAAGLRWTHGGPGLIATKDADDLHHFHDVGVFVGPVPKSGESIEVV